MCRWGGNKTYVAGVAVGACVAGVAVGRVWLGWHTDVCGWGGSRTCTARVAV